MLKRLPVLALLLGVSLASAKNYAITISNACQAGGTQLQPGQYTLKLDGDKGVLVDMQGKSIEAVMKVETVERKYDQTTIGTSNEGGVNRLRWIAVGGSKARVVFE